MMQTTLPGLSMVTFDPIDLTLANRMLVEWGHKMGSCDRPAGYGLWCHALFYERQPVSVTIATTLIRDAVGGGHDMALDRSNCIELSRLCAARPGLCRVALRLWREFVFPSLGYEYAISYQDADLHSGLTYRFDGWTRLPRISSSGTDLRGDRVGRRKWVWLWRLA